MREQRLVVLDEVVLVRPVVAHGEDVAEVDPARAGVCFVVNSKSWLW